MLRYATWKVAAIIGMIADRVVGCCAEHAGAVDAAGDVPAPCRGCRCARIVLGLDLQGGSHVLLEVDQTSVLETQVDICATTSAVFCAKSACRSPAGSGRRRAACSSVSPIPMIARKSCRGSASCSNRPAMCCSGAAAPVRDVKRFARRPDPGHRHRCGDCRQGAPRCRSIDRSLAPPRRRARHDRTEHSGQGADRILVQVPGLQDPEKLKQILAHTANLEFRLVAEPARPAGRGTVDHDGRTGELPVEKQVMVQGEDLDRCAARLRSAHQRADRQFPLQYSRRAAIRRRHDEECRQTVRHRS